MKLLKNKKIGDNEILRKKAVKNFFLNKKVIAGICIILVFALSLGIYKFKAAKQKPPKSNVKYTTLSKTNIKTTIGSSGSIKSGSSTNIYSNLEYNVASINVEVGDVVKKGDVLATIDTATLQEQISEAEQTFNSNQAKNNLTLASAKQKYENMQYLYDNNLNTDIINAEKAVGSAELDLEDKRKTYEYYKVMLANGAMSQDTVNKEKITVDGAKDTYDKATVALEAIKVNAKQALAEVKMSYESAQVIANDKTAELALEDKKKKLADAKVLATVDGTVTNVNAIVGIQSTGALFVIQDLNDLIVNVTVDERDVSDVKVGQKAEITTDVSGSDVIEAEVKNVEPISSNISSSANTNGGKATQTPNAATSNSASSDVSYNVKVQLTGHNDKIKVGMNAVVNIITNESENVYSVPYGAVVTKDGQSLVYSAVKQGNEYVVKDIAVTKGLESDIDVAIDGADLADNMIILNEPTNYSVGSTVEI
ncbi:multidrug efflux pump subunit AcrA (membrane-fusion protein) [Clostridium saccharoperbutylacetonicum]|uniref:Multidrug resistance efflux pump n=1 Tax=Clostridium saccharoperbutylacetonicum N1-4(HMT) TaxID=931276 RepID=M1LNU7_9CLOT|nr:efflux RND transporter periplasmic adaptor subunit [Clostridium saccharoperbutylacetonicum]AGF54515.1 multidrug resistance efflux pump [Clostridium saccharoperbutylacetonicum N1-4(HMT)]NRT58965.1 multidrug efflux pump subunit AcrA (membrane-fusion protein) [Clostridium saccharoperbutylacetonicum]NSB28153.1 multidrug efflux pump subunit AcrA (membrane-fusion protein) [Clostridium saccharoperbutylacetonicum]NSB41641.1 multidrug efflux pump subunit AcrA (membrane-fusion protein) [Clostridium sa